MVEVSTRDFERSHGRRPRGEGQWAFFFDRKNDVGDAQWFRGTYGEAKKQAVAYAREHKHQHVEVGS